MFQVNNIINFINILNIEIIQFNDLIKSIAEVLEKHSKVIEQEKLKALGKRNQLYDEIESRGKREQELRVLIREKKRRIGTSQIPK